MNEIPRIYAWGGEFKWEEVYMAVSVELVEHIIDVLRAYLARSWPEEGLHSEDDATHRLMATTCSALGSLVDAHAAHYRRHGVRELVFQIQEFRAAPMGEISAWRDEEEVRAAVEALRDDRHVNPAALDALLALHAQLVARREEP